MKIFFETATLKDCFQDVYFIQFREGVNNFNGRNNVFLIDPLFK